MSMIFAEFFSQNMNQKLITLIHFNSKTLDILIFALLTCIQSMSSANVQPFFKFVWIFPTKYRPIGYVLKSKSHKKQ
jgi:hypothetical protein